MKKERKKHHYQSRTRLYRIWGGMKSRCSDSKTPIYKYYGARGISVCQEWHDSKNFIKWAMDNGYNDSLSIDRTNNDGNYCPENCKWVTQEHQVNNRSNNVFIEYQGKKLTMSQWGKEMGFPKVGIVRNRIYAGWNEIDAITTPVMISGNYYKNKRT
jgi:hypothetical protein